MDRFRKDAKSLLREFRAGEREAVARAEAVLGERAGRRFLLSDAQHVVAREHGHRTWAELRRAKASGPLDELRSLERGEIVLEPGLLYREGDPVRVRVRKRLHRYDLDDLEGAVRLAGKPPGWFDAAVVVAEGEWWLNLNRRGAVFVPAVEGGVDLEWLVGRVAGASAAVYAAVLDLES